MRPYMGQKLKKSPIMNILFFFKKQLKEFIFFDKHVTSMFCFCSFFHRLMIHHFKVDRIQ